MLHEMKTPYIWARKPFQHWLLNLCSCIPRYLSKHMDKVLPMTSFNTKTAVSRLLQDGSTESTAGLK